MNTYIDTVKETVTHLGQALSDILTRNKHYVGQSHWTHRNEYGKGSISYIRLWQGHVLTQYEINELYKQRDNKTYYTSSTS